MLDLTTSSKSKWPVAGELSMLLIDKQGKSRACPALTGKQGREDSRYLKNLNRRCVVNGSMALEEELPHSCHTA